MSGLLSGQVALVAGSDAALREAMASAFQRAGVRVACAGALPVSAADAEALVAGVVERHGGLDTLALVPGTRPARPFQDATPEDWRSVFAELRSVFALVRACALRMRGQRKGRVLGVASPAGVVGVPGHALQGALDGALEAFLRIAALDMGRYGITANLLLRHAPAGDMARVFQGAGLATPGQQRAADLAELAVVLGSEGAAPLNGQVLSAAAQRAYLWARPGPWRSIFKYGARWTVPEFASTLPRAFLDASENRVPAPGLPLDGRVAVVTGGGRGIGRAVALELARAGARLLVNDLGCVVSGEGVSPGPAEEVVAEIRRMGGQAAADSTSVASPEGGRRVVETARERFGRVDVLVNMAGIQRAGLLYKLQEADWDAVLAVHLGGHIGTLAAALPLFAEQGYGRCINVTSTAALLGDIGAAAYGTAKGAIVGLTRALAQEYHATGVTVNAIAPHAQTRMAAAGGVADSPPPEDIAPLVAYLASSHAADVTGAVIGAGGGLASLYSPAMPWRSVELYPGLGAEGLASALLPALAVHVANPAPPGGVVQHYYQ